jgi:hypothetical protein
MHGRSRTELSRIATVGQTIEILKTVRMGDVIIIDTDRSLTGQDGEAFAGPTSAGAVDSFGARLAVRLFETDASIDHVFVMSNAVSVRRRGAWEDQSVAAVEQAISRFFRFYADSPAKESAEE